MPWLWRYGLVSRHPFHHREQEHGNDVTPRKRRRKKSVLWTGSWAHSESFAPQTRRCGGRRISIALTEKMTTDGANEQRTLFVRFVHFKRQFLALHSLMTLKCLYLKGPVLGYSYMLNSRHYSVSEHVHPVTHAPLLRKCMQKKHAKSALFDITEGRRQCLPHVCDNRAVCVFVPALRTPWPLLCVCPLKVQRF